MVTIPRALTIAGSDSGGGAGIQADLKTFAALGVHGACAITAITAQNTRTVTAIQDVDARIVKAQINTVVNDIGIDAVKTGMLHTSEIIGIVAQEIRSFKIPTVVDPVMVAKSGAKLLHDDAVSSLKRELLPDATVATPNAPEATVLSGIKVDSVEAAKEAARKISSMGPVGVVVKGGHIPYRGKVADVLYVNGEYHVFETEELPSRTTHGTGCTFSSAIAAYMARGENVTQAVKLAKVFVQDAIRFGVLVGEGVGPVNPMASLYKEAEKHKILVNVTEALRLLESSPVVWKVIPEVNSNLAMALEYATDVGDVAGIPGRILRVGSLVKSYSCPMFGGSRHVASTVLAAKAHNPAIRAAMNIRYSEEVLRSISRLGLTASSYDRRMEPPEMKAVEGMTTRWGAEEAIRKAEKFPDVIYHDGDWGKEAMVTVLGEDAVSVARTVIKIAGLL